MAYSTVQAPLTDTVGCLSNCSLRKLIVYLIAFHIHCELSFIFTSFLLIFASYSSFSLFILVSFRSYFYFCHLFGYLITVQLSLLQFSQFNLKK